MITLTDHQEDRANKITELLRAGHKRIILKGSAGVGKTALATVLVDRFKRDYSINRKFNNGFVFVTAPTNKALAVLQGKIMMSSGIAFKTTHAALRLVRNVNSKTGEETYVKGWTPKNDEFKSCRIAIVDECSMISSQILEFLRDLPFPIIFIGDDKQINPVGELDTPVFNAGYPTVELTEIIRQGKGNPIIDLSRDIDLIYFKEPSLIEGKGYTYNDNLDLLIDDLAEVNGTDELKYLAWTNVQIDSINKLVRERRYGNPKKLEEEETIVFNKPMGPFFTNQEFKIDDLKVVTADVPIPSFSTKFDSSNCPTTATDRIKMKFYRVNDMFNVIHEDGETVFRTASSTLLSNCKKLGWNWKGWYFFTEQFADIKYNHALSTHKSQGSTYKTSIINVANININSQLEERNRLLYTAITRSSDLVILNNVK